MSRLRLAGGDTDVYLSAQVPEWTQPIRYRREPEVERLQGSLSFYGLEITPADSRPSNIYAYLP